MEATEVPALPSKARLRVKLPRRCSVSPRKDAEGYGEPLSPTARLFRQPQFNCHILVFLGFGKKIHTDAVKAALESTLVRHPRFSSVQEIDGSGRSRWVRTEVNLDDHVVYPGLGPVAADGDPIVGDRIVENYASGLCCSALDTSRPLWDLHILDIRTSEAAVVAVFRIHHSLGDGISLMSLFLACTRRTIDYESLPSLPVAHRRSSTAVSGSTIWILLSYLWTCLVYAWNTLISFLLFFSTAFFLKDSKTPLMGMKGVEYRQKRFAHCTLSFDDLRTIKNAMGSTINDVLVGVTSAALSRYLDRNHDGHLPRNLRIRSTLLVNIRPNTAINALALTMKEGRRSNWGNRMGYVILNFPIMRCQDPLDYIRKGVEITQKKKKSLEVMFTFISALLIVKIFGVKAAVLLCHRVLSNTTLSFSNVVGPTDEVGFCGSPLVYIAPTVYGHPQAHLLCHNLHPWSSQSSPVMSPLPTPVETCLPLLYKGVTPSQH
ncbi:hypothetical protein HPP92_007920 [Vanilla planifolia]|uniref:Diacylglycerol O-acyltransferase n=1 Tax=Vanilla planifolia TaxID=51239 RepID=A0A835RSC6_VANPL|nr:hypothetical protein HPP92_007920 [Vanilla planifolia]